MQAIPKILPDLIGAKSAEMLFEHYVNGMTMRDIGALHGVSFQAASNRIKSAREKLQSYGLWPSHWTSPHGNSNTASARLQRAAFSPN